LVLIFDFTQCVVTWNDITIPMQQNGSIHSKELSPVDMQDIDAPEILQHATCHMERHITLNQYHKHNHQSMIFKCTHLSRTQQDVLLDLFDQFFFPI
jgi:hypothetical protein